MIPKIIYNVLILFLMMLAGVIIKKCKLVPDGFGKGLSNIVLYIGQPALIFLAYVREFDKTILINSLWIILFATVAHIIFAVASHFAFKGAENAKRKMLSFATIFSNAAFMGIPLIGAAMGDDALIYASMYNIVFNLFLWSLGVNICTSPDEACGDNATEGIKLKEEHKGSLLKAVLHPVTIAAAVGLVFFFTPLNRYMNDSNYLGGLLSEGFGMLKGLVAPLSMIIIGIRLADMNLKGFFSDKYLYIFLALRHFALPIAVCAIMRLVIVLGVPVSLDILTVVAILACTPSASSSTMFAERYDCDSAYVSKLVAVSTIISVVTMPAVIYLATLGLA